MRYIFVTDQLPLPGLAGHLALNFAVVAWLVGLGHSVEVLLVGARLGGLRRYRLAPVAGPRVRRFGDWVVPVSAGGVARAVVPARLRGGAEAVLGGFASAVDLAWCGRYIARARPDAVLVDTMFRAGLMALPELAGVNSVVVAHDVFHRRHRALVTAGYRVRPERLTREDEAGYLARARHIAAIQPEEAALLAAMCPGANVFTAPMPASPCPRPAGLKVIPGRLVFVGSAALPNLDGLRWFFDEVWQLLAGRGISLDLVGDCGPALRQVPTGVTRLGRVKHLAPVLHRAALAIAPLRVGSGLKIKLLDYARHGLFTVATPASLAGFAADDAAPFWPAADAGAFARAILRGLAEPGPPAAALDYVSAHYGEAASFAGLAEALSA